MRPSLRGATWAVMCATLALATARDARAEDDDLRAFALFERSEAAYEAGRFDEAIALLQESYRLKPEPVLLYNMGRAYEGIGDLGAAAAAYERFLAAKPGTPDRGALEHRIATLRQQVAEREALRRRADREAKEKEREKPPARSASVVPWIVAGVGAAGIGAGGVVGWLGVQKHDDATNEPTYVEADQLQRQAESLARTANVCFVAGGVLLVVGVVWGILDASAARRGPRR